MVQSILRIPQSHVFPGKPPLYNTQLSTLLASSQPQLCQLCQPTMDLPNSSMGNLLPERKSQTPMLIVTTTTDKSPPCKTHKFVPQTDHQGIHTNNYTESWHRLLKTSYLPPLEQLRIDEVVQILTDNVESHYRWAQIQVGIGFAAQTTNQFQQRAKLLAEAFTKEDLQLLGVACSQNSKGGRITLQIRRQGGQD